MDNQRDNVALTENTEAEATNDISTTDNLTSPAVSEDNRASSKKLEANRRNALKSTGPRTETGKRRVSRNAEKHGMFSSNLIVRHPEAKEFPADFDALRARVRKHYKPVGFIEEFWAEKIAALGWKMRRVTRFESAAIAQQYVLAGKRRVARDLVQQQEVSLPPVETGAEADHLLLPDDATANKVLRYDSSINKQMNYAMLELERLQKSRRSEQKK